MEKVLDRGIKPFNVIVILKGHNWNLLIMHHQLLHSFARLGKPRLLLPYLILWLPPMPCCYLTHENAWEVQAQKQPHVFQGNHHKYLPPHVGFKAFYGGQPSMLESLGHSKKIHVELVKGTQIVHYIHVTNVKNLQVES